MTINVVPQSGIQVLIIAGAALIIAGAAPKLGTDVLMLGIGAWLFYNLLSLFRQL